MRYLACLLALLLVAPAQAQRAILIYTHNGQGYVHDNIPASVAALEAIARRLGYRADVSDDPAVFTTANLRRYKALVFANTNNEAFASQTQRDAFRRFIEAGGGFVGIHSAAGSERSWDYFAQVVGGRFVEHPPLQPLTLHVLDPHAAITRGLPAVMVRPDECYLYTRLAPDIHPLLGVERSSLQGTDKLKTDLQDYPAMLPLAWTHRFDGGREFYLGLGHRSEDYKDPVFVGLLERGLRWTLQR